MPELDIRNVDLLREQAESWRRRQGWTQLDMAQALHIGLQTYGNFKRGQSDLLKATRIRLVDLLSGKTNGNGNGSASHGTTPPAPAQNRPGNGAHAATDASAQRNPAAVPSADAFPGAPTDTEIVQALALAQMRQRPDYIQELGTMAVRLTRLKRLAEEERAKLDRILDDLDRRNNGK